MRFVLGLAQCGFPSSGNVIDQIDGFMDKAQRLGVRLLVFPENLMYAHEPALYETSRPAEPLDGPFVQQVGSLARRHGLWTCITMYQTNPNGAIPFNTAVVLDDHGNVAGTYTKCHLYDAHGVRESDIMTAGNELCPPIQTPFCTLGVGICYDLRFPEAARAMACAGCDLIVFPAAWHDGPQKRAHWETLLRARAIENECYVAGICHAGPRYVGVSAAYDPLGNAIAHGTNPLLTCTIDPTAVRMARNAMPVLKHRRPELYGRITTTTRNVTTE